MVLQSPPMDSVYDARPWLSYYPSGVPKDVDVPLVPLTRLLDDAADSYPRNKAVAFFGRTLTYKQLRDRIDRFAAALRDLGVDKGDRVAIILPNCPQQLIAFYGTLRLGAVVVQCNPLYTAHELRYQMADSGAKVAVVFDRAYDTLAQARPGTYLQHVIVTSLVEYLPARKRFALRLPLKKAAQAREELITDVPDDGDLLFFGDLLKTNPGRLRQAHIDPLRDLALLQYTGGTTGQPKGAMLNHRNLVANAYQTLAWDPKIREGHEVTLAVLPLFHAFGLTFCLTATVLGAGMLVLVPKFDADLVLEAINKWKPTILPGVPPLYSQLIEHPEIDKHDLASIRTCVSGAMPLPRQTVNDFQKVTGGRLVQGYGLTETSPVALSNPLDGNARHVSIGIPIPSTEARIVSESNPDEVMPIGAAGELQVRGPQVFQGYWNQPQESAEVLRDGWACTGDIGFMSPDGFFTLIDRKRDVIMVNGFSVFPSEIEDIIRQHPAVQDCAIIGILDHHTGEAVKACIVIHQGYGITDEDLLAHCSRQLVDYKIPKQIEIRQDLPRNMLGKVMRRLLRDEQGTHSLSNLPPRQPGTGYQPPGPG